MFAAALVSLLAAVGPMVSSPYRGAISIDAQTGQVLSESGADVKAYPASVTKLMTAYLVLDDVAAGRLKLTDAVVASKCVTKADAHYRQPSCIGLAPGEAKSVDEMLVWLMVHSANDAAIYLAEKCSGSVAAFVARMNAKAKQLGMASTAYYNPNGLPPPPSAKERRFNVSTCRDQVRLARALLKAHPEILRYTSIKNIKLPAPNVRDRRRVMEPRNIVNHNNLMVKNKLKVINPDGSEAIDGLKTGYIDAGGSSIVLTGKRKGKRAIVVVLGSARAAERDEHAGRLLNDALSAIAW